jgi:DNA mismatch repair protein MutS
LDSTEKNNKVAETPLMKQYNEIKAKHPDALLLFRVGDFYETFGEDAIKASKILGIILTKRANGTASEIALAGFPHHSLNTYLPKLVRAGQRVAICDQLEDPKLTKSIVKRGVTDLITPGIAIDDQVLTAKENNFLAAVYVNDTHAAVAFLDVSTGEFSVAEGKTDFIARLIKNFQPKELLFEKNKYHSITDIFGNQFYTYGIDEWAWNLDYAKETIEQFFKVKSLKGFGLEDKKTSIICAGLILHYLKTTQNNNRPHINRLSRIEEHDFLWMDYFTIKSLELVGTDHPEGTSLLDIIDFTLTPMGGRMLRRWVLMPLIDKQKIEERLNWVNFFKQKKLKDEVRLILGEFGDIERIISKIASNKVSPKELLLLAKSIHFSNQIIALLQKFDLFAPMYSAYQNSDEVQNLIKQTIHPDAPAIIGKGRLIKEGVDAKLDEYYQLLTHGKDLLLDMQNREIEATGITSLKINYNNVFGYFIEVRNTHKDKVPDTWIRKQTLVSAERYITEELKDLENKILRADEEIGKIEAEIFRDLIEKLCLNLQKLQNNAKIIAQIDVLSALGVLANENNYHLPQISDDFVIDIKEGRHPVIEKKLKVGDVYVSNDIYLDDSTQQIIMVTGPNMSGKSALLRQTALITILAQIGSLVPAKSAKIGVVDKIFTRVGASDNISTGESTFMVEMNETSNILNNLSARSLILLDEIGRGTSTYDGVSIAWAIAEFIHEYPMFKAKTLFATHYHELNKMTDEFERIKNYSVSVKQINDKIIFLRKLQKGGSEHSFGINVAQLAGMPKLVVEKAKKILSELEQKKGEPNTKKIPKEGVQLSFIQLDDPILIELKEELKSIDINTLTPVEALMKLNEIKRKIG